MLWGTKSHESIIGGGGGGGGMEGGYAKSKHFVRNSVKEVKYHKMYHFEQVKILSWKVKKSLNLTHGTQESQILQICRMVEFLIDNIFVKFGGCLFRQVIGIPIGTNCAPLLADLFLYSYESEFLDNMIRGGHRKLARSFNLCYRYIDDLIVFNNKKFGVW